MNRLASALLAVAVAVGVAGCAAVLNGGGEPDAEEVFERALASLEGGDYHAAFGDLVWVYRHHWEEPVSRRALLVLAAAELDPRNRSQRLGEGARLTGGYLRAPTMEPWLEPVAETLYLLSLELGAAEREVVQARQEAAEARAEARRAAAPPRELPRLPGPSVASRIRTVTQDRDRAQARVRELEARVRRLEQELVRVKETLKP